ncbi:MAG: YgjV family protein [Ruminococcaceae bacterium]|nr:YgjV family protein [Oscillospiraceae bacterium]
MLFTDIVLSGLDKAGQFFIYFMEVLILDNISIIVANIISIISCTMMVLIGLIKNKNKILAAQCVQFTLMGVSHYLLGGMGGVIATVVSIIRNLVFFKCKPSVPLKLLFVVLSVVLSLGTVTLNPITWLPILATSLFTWVIDSEDIIKFKKVMIITVCMWFVYDAVHLNFISAAFDAFTVVSTGYSIWQIKKEKRTEE